MFLTPFLWPNISICNKEKYHCELCITCSKHLVDTIIFFADLKVVPLFYSGEWPFRQRNNLYRLLLFRQESLIGFVPLYWMDMSRHYHRTVRATCAADTLKVASWKGFRIGEFPRYLPCEEGGVNGVEAPPRNIKGVIFRTYKKWKISRRGHLPDNKKNRSMLFPRKVFLAVICPKKSGK